MRENKYDLFIAEDVAEISHMISENFNLSEIDAINLFIQSKTYDNMNDISTGAWMFSPLVNYDVFVKERVTGRLSYPM